MHSRDKIEEQKLNEANLDVILKNLERKIKEYAAKS
jgi:hypothetical protein